MTINEKINADIKAAMRDRDKTTLTTLRSLKTAINYYEKSGKGEVDDLITLDLIKKQIKQRQDSINEFNKAGRDDLVNKETKELEILTKYLPEQLTEDRVAEEVDIIIQALGATTIRDMGGVMAACKKSFEGRADNSVVARLVKQKLT